MKNMLAAVLAILMILGLSAPALAASLSISPAKVEFEVPANGSAEVTFMSYEYTGNLTIDCENIPLKVEPATIAVTAKKGGDKIVLTFSGNTSRGSKIYEGKIRFLAGTGGMVAMGIKVKARVTNLVKGQTPVLATPEESQAATKALPQDTTPAVGEIPEIPASNPGAQVVGPDQSPSGPPAANQWLILTGICVGIILVVAIIVDLFVKARRRR